jgi:glycosyltransferase involved in cell wall biosynthesis
VSERQHKKVLFVTFDFPPARTSAVYRLVGMSKYLVNFGWLPKILTVKELRDQVQDPALLDDYPPEIEIVRTGYIAIDGWEKWLIRTMGRSKTPEERSTGNVGTQQSISQRSPQLGVVRTLLRKIDGLIQSILYFPDRTAGWIPHAIFAGRHILHIERFDLIYTSSPPRSALIVGLFLKLATGTPWIAEFRDPWYPRIGRPMRNLFERWMLRRVFKNADRIVLISNGLAEELRKTFSVPAEKINVVSNGYDEAEYARVPNGSPFPEGFLHLSHFGTVYNNFAGQFFCALRELLQEHPALKDRVRVHIIGFPDDATRAFAASSDVGPIMDLHDFMPQRQALQAMRSSDVLLLFLGWQRTSRLSGLGKIFWYLRVGKPVFAIACPGDCTQLIERAGAGVVIPPDDLQGIKRALLELMSRPHFAGPDQELVSSLRYDRLAGELAAVLDGVIER